MTRGERRHRTEKKLAKRRRQASEILYPIDVWVPRCAYRKIRFAAYRHQSPFDCGHTQCFVCHEEKLEPGADRLRRKRDAKQTIDESRAP